MTRHVAVSLLAVAAFSAGHPVPVAAQDDYPGSWSGAVVLSTLGIGGELSGRANPVIGLRGGYFLLGSTHRDEIKGIRYRLKPRLRNGTVMLDLHPGGGVFRLSGGLVFSNSHVDATGLLDGPVDIGGDQYAPEDVGTLFGKAEYGKTTMPYVGIGVAGNTRFTYTVDLGIVFSGYPRVRLRADSPLTGPEREAFEQNLGREEAQIQQDIESQWWAKFYPVFSIGFKLRF